MGLKYSVLFQPVYPVFRYNVCRKDITMKKVLLYILIMSWLFTALDWKIVHATRWTHPEWKDWMHAHEKPYMYITQPLEIILCTPCIALKPIFYEAMKNVEAGQVERDSITHAPDISIYGFYHLVERGQPWTFVPWWSWFLYWLSPSVVWWFFIKRFTSIGE